MSILILQRILILNGITRQVVLVCEELTIPVVEKAFTLEEAFEMDEFFLTSTTSEVMPVTTIDGRIGSSEHQGHNKKVTRSI